MAAQVGVKERCDAATLVGSSAERVTLVGDLEAESTKLEGIPSLVRFLNSLTIPRAGGNTIERIKAHEERMNLAEIFKVVVRRIPMMQIAGSAHRRFEARACDGCLRWQRRSDTASPTTGSSCLPPHLSPPQPWRLAPARARRDAQAAHASRT